MKKLFHVGIEFNVNDIGGSDGWTVEFVVRWYGEPAGRCEETGLWSRIASQNIVTTTDDLLPKWDQVGKEES